MRTALLAVTALIAGASCAIAGPTARLAELKITNSHLVATCLDGKAISARERSWHVSEPVSLTFTMRNEPRSGIENAVPGFATVTFSPEVDHRYEIEVRASVIANSQRVWKQGDWTAVVRDRTTDTVVSGAPTWIESGCGVR